MFMLSSQKAFGWLQERSPHCKSRCEWLSVERAQPLTRGEVLSSLSLSCLVRKTQPCLDRGIIAKTQETPMQTPLTEVPGTLSGESKANGLVASERARTKEPFGVEAKAFTGHRLTLWEPTGESVHAQGLPLLSVIPSCRVPL